jgi:hypothetical protein
MKRIRGAPICWSRTFPDMLRCQEMVLVVRDGRALGRVPVRSIGTFSLALCASVVVAACRGDKHNIDQPHDSIAAALASRTTASATATSAPTPTGTGGAPGTKPTKMRRETVDFETCWAAKPNAMKEGEDQGDGLIRCPLSSGLVAEQGGSACFDVNRLVDDQDVELFTSQMQAPKGTVFVTDRRFVLYRCEGHPGAVLQAGKLYAEFTSAENPCHGAKPLRTTYLVQDIRNQQRFDDVSLKRAHELLAEIAKNTPCGRLEP